MKSPVREIAACRDPAEAWRERDRRCLWHPYTRINDFEQTSFPVMVRGEGVRLYDIEGVGYLDGISSWWSACLGHGHPGIVAAIRRQAEVLQHSILGGMSHPGVIELGERLTELAPPGLTRAYFAGDGSSAVEAAIRMAVEANYHRGLSRKTRIIALRDAYHGDTLGAVGAGYLEEFHAPLRNLLNLAHCAPSPHCFACKARHSCDLHCFEGMRRLMEEHADTTAAVILEPLVQGSAGMRIYPEQYLRKLRDWCDRTNLFLIADEIAVGFGRTGRMFACEHAGITPDLLCLGKGLTGGSLPLSAVLVTEPVFDLFRDTATQDRTFYHGHTFCGNPIAVAAALATLDAFDREEVLVRSKPLQKTLSEAFQSFAALDAVDRWAAFGAIGVVRLKAGPEAARRAAAAAIRSRLLIRPLGDILYLCPPLNTPSSELRCMLSIFRDAIQGVSKGMDPSESTRAIAE